MEASLRAVLTDAERLLIARTGRAELSALDEDEAIVLEARDEAGPGQVLQPVPPVG